jgi:hypothetical protein
MTERLSVFRFGALFTKGDDGKDMFEFTVDAGNKIGPRPATAADKAKHQKAWLSYTAGVSIEDMEPENAPLKKKKGR